MSKNSIEKSDTMTVKSNTEISGADLQQLQNKLDQSRQRIQLRMDRSFEDLKQSPRRADSLDGSFDSQSILKKASMKKQGDKNDNSKNMFPTLSKAPMNHSLEQFERNQKSMTKTNEETGHDSSMVTVNAQDLKEASQKKESTAAVSRGGQSPTKETQFINLMEEGNLAEDSRRYQIMEYEQLAAR